MSSDPVMDAYTQAYNASGQMIQAFGVLKTDGSVLWQSNNWDLAADAQSLIAGATSKATSIVQNQVKYTTLRTSPESLVAKNIAGSGFLILAKIDGDKWVIAWAAAEAAADGVYIDVDRAAKSLKGKI